jgi:hypothetical protein
MHCKITSLHRGPSEQDQVYSRCRCYKTWLSPLWVDIYPSQVKVEMCLKFMHPELLMSSENKSWRILCVSVCVLSGWGRVCVCTTVSLSVSSVGVCVCVCVQQKKNVQANFLYKWTYFFPHLDIYRQWELINIHRHFLWTDQNICHKYFTSKIIWAYKIQEIFISLCNKRHFDIIVNNTLKI